MRERGAAAALIFKMLDQAIAMQRDGGTKVELTVELAEPAARALGLAGEGTFTLTLWPCREILCCSNCRRPTGDHCKVHVIPCCPGKCSGAGLDSGTTTG